MPSTCRLCPPPPCLATLLSRPSPARPVPPPCPPALARETDEPRDRIPEEKISKLTLTLYQATPTNQRFQTCTYIIQARGSRPGHFFGLVHQISKAHLSHQHYVRLSTSTRTNHFKLASHSGICLWRRPRSNGHLVDGYFNHSIEISRARHRSHIVIVSHPTTNLQLLHHRFSRPLKVTFAIDHRSDCLRIRFNTSLTFARDYARFAKTLRIHLVVLSSELPLTERHLLP